MKNLLFNGIKSILNLAYQISPNLGNRVAYFFFTRPLFQVQIKTELDYLKTMQSSWENFEGKKIRVYRIGQGNKVILLVHGWRGYAGNFYELMNSFPLNKYSFIVFDAPAHHASEGTKTNVFQIIRLCKFAISKYKPNYIIGHSMGSAVAVSALSESKDIRINGLILLSCPNSFEYLVESFGQNFSLNEKQLISFKEKVQSKLQKSFEESKIENLIKNFSIRKVLLIHDKLDKVLPFENALKINSSSNGNIKFIPIENVGHYKMLKYPQVLQSVMNFINDN